MQLPFCRRRRCHCYIPTLAAAAAAVKIRTPLLASAAAGHSANIQASSSFSADRYRMLPLRPMPLQFLRRRCPIPSLATASAAGARLVYSANGTKLRRVSINAWNNKTRRLKRIALAYANGDAILKEHTSSIRVAKPLAKVGQSATITE